MKKTTLLFSLIIAFCLFSCSESDELKLTKIEGQPSLFQGSDKKDITLSYRNNQIIQIINQNGSVAGYTFQNDMLSEINFSPPKDVMDGNGASRFKKVEENRIRVESWGEPSSLLYVQEIELSEEENTIKITDIGTFSPVIEEYTKVKKGDRYVRMTLDPDTKNIIKREEFRIENDELIALYLYDYDHNPGSMSNIDWPLWLFVYTCNSRASNYDSGQRQFFNYKNNLIKETVLNNEENTAYTVNYTYTYNSNGFPVDATNDYKQNPNSILIHY